MTRLVTNLIKRTRETVSRATLKGEQQYADSFSEISNAKDELLREIASQWGVIDIALTNIEVLTERLHELDNEVIHHKRRSLISL